MTLLFRNQYIGNVNTLDLPIAYKPPGTQPGDFMLLRIITLNNREKAPNISGWKLLTYDYSNNVSQFIFTKICDTNQDKITIVRKQTGSNYIRVYSWYSDTDNYIVLDQNSLKLPTSFKKKEMFNIEKYRLEYDIDRDKCLIKLLNGNVHIEFSIYEDINKYSLPLFSPTFNSIEIDDTNSVLLKWNNKERTLIQLSIDNDKWEEAAQVDADNKQYAIPDLLPNQLYYFRLFSMRDNQLSEPSKILSIITKGNILLRSSTYCLSSAMNPRIVVSPKGVQKGDLMLMQVSYEHGLIIDKISPGWKILQQYEGETVSLRIYYKIATRKEPASYMVYHRGLRNKKILLAIGAFYSLNNKPIRISDSAIQYNEPSEQIPFPVVFSESNYSLGIGLSVRDLETNLKFSIDTTTMWSIDKNLRTTGIFQAYHDTNEINITPIHCNYGASVSASIVLYEGEQKTEIAPLTPTGFKAKKLDSAIISLAKGIT